MHRIDQFARAANPRQSGSSRKRSVKYSAALRPARRCRTPPRRPGGRAGRRGAPRGCRARRRRWRTSATAGASQCPRQGAHAHPERRRRGRGRGCRPRGQQLALAWCPVASVRDWLMVREETRQQWLAARARGAVRTAPGFARRPYAEEGPDLLHRLPLAWPSAWLEGVSHPAWANWTRSPTSVGWTRRACTPPTAPPPWPQAHSRAPAPARRMQTTCRRCGQASRRSSRRVGSNCRSAPACPAPGE